MKIFELHFNPIAKDRLLKKGQLADLIFDSFCYEPQNIYERRLGYLFLVGELKNPLPQNFNFLENLANFLKREYYTSPIKLSPENAFKEVLKKANNYLEKIVKEGNVSWLGNFNSAILSIKNLDLNFSKIGNIKILLLRYGQLMDIGKNLELEELEPYPLKIFGKIASGKLAENDIVLVMSKESYDFFFEKNLFKKLIQVFTPDQKENHKLIEKKLKDFLKANEKDFEKIYGFCLICLLTKEEILKGKSKIFSLKKKPEKFSFKKILSPVFLSFKNIIKLILFFILKTIKNFANKIITRKKIKLSPLPLKEKDSIKLAVKTKEKKKKILKIKKIRFQLKISLNKKIKETIILVLILALLLLLGFLLFKKQTRVELNKNIILIEKIKEEVNRTESILMREKNEEEVFNILKEAKEKITPLTLSKSKIKNEAIELNNLIDEKFKKLTKLENITDPEIFFIIDKKDFIAQKIISYGQNIYAFNQFSENILKIDDKKEKNLLVFNQKFDDAVTFKNFLLFFKKPNRLFFLKNDQFVKDIYLELPAPNFDYKEIASFQNNLYLLDKNGEIYKYQNFSNPQKWLSTLNQKNQIKKSFAVNGDILVLNEDNSISFYSSGKLKEVINLKIFPYPKDFKKILANFDYIYIIEPVEKRLIVLDQKGNLIKQIFSEKFDNLLDFTVSEDGKTIRLLNGNKIFQITI